MARIYRNLLATGLCLILLLCCKAVPAQVVDGDHIMDQPMAENLCALTFDDGPSRYTPQLLDTLAEYGIPATFFLLGKQAEYHPHTVQRIAAEGHEIGNHSYSHPNLRVIPQDQKKEELHRTDGILREMGVTPLFFRPPYGAYDSFTVDVAEALGMTIVLWSMDSRDWRTLPADYAKLTSTRGSVYETGTLRGVFLFHDTYRRTVDDLPRIIAQLRAGGCQRFVTLSQYLAGLKDPEPGLLMTRHIPKRKGSDSAAAMPAQKTFHGPVSAWPAGSGPMPLARSSRPWQPSHVPTLQRSARSSRNFPTGLPENTLPRAQESRPLKS